MQLNSLEIRLCELCLAFLQVMYIDTHLKKLISRCQGGYKRVIKVIQFLPCYFYYTVGKGSS